MQFTVTINQVKALEWGLNATQAMLFAFIYECPSWCRPTKTEKGIFYALSKAKLIEELPLLTNKLDTAYRLLKQLEAAGVIDLSHTPGITLVRLTEKGQEWNRKIDGSEKYPSPAGEASEKNPIWVGKKSEAGRKKIREGSEKSPTNQDTSNQVTNQETSQVSPDAAGATSGGELVAMVAPAVEQAPRVEIPADMPGPKDRNCKTFRSWANYAFAYNRRYGVWPAWNAQAGGMLGKLIDRIGADLAPKVAAFYIGVNDARLIRECHPLSLLLQGCEGYRTQYLTGRQMTGVTAQQIERKQANLTAGEEAARRITERRSGGGRNEFL